MRPPTAANSRTGYTAGSAWCAASATMAVRPIGEYHVGGNNQPASPSLRQTVERAF